jgi:hypothetical protein
VCLNGGMKGARKILFLTQGLQLVTSGVGFQRSVCPRLSSLQLLVERQMSESCNAKMTAKKSLAEWSFAPSLLAARLPLDPDKVITVRRNVPNVIFSEGTYQ